jgi:predicted lipid-binding transport protein (Tim44 family)
LSSQLERPPGKSDPLKEYDRLVGETSRWAGRLLVGTLVGVAVAFTLVQISAPRAAMAVLLLIGSIPLLVMWGIGFSYANRRRVVARQISQQVLLSRADVLPTEEKRRRAHRARIYVLILAICLVLQMGLFIVRRVATP